MLNIPTQLVSRAYAGTSFNPERRGARALAGFEAELQGDLAHLTEQAEKGGTQQLLQEELQRYVDGYRRRVLALLHSESRCVSSVIAGPANFPARRMQKRAEISLKRWEELQDFRGRAKRAALRVLRPDLRPIMAGDADALERLQASIEAAERAHARMKAANAAIRKHAKSGEGHQVAALMEHGFSEAQAHELLKPDFAGRVGFPDYAIANSNANIRRMQQRLKALEAAKAAPVVEVQGSAGIRLEDDPPANRVRLYFPAKPDAETRGQLRKHGFRWAPSFDGQPWQAYRNHWSIQFARQCAGVVETS